MIGIPSNQEIMLALFDIGEDKAPGSDGFSSCFFKKAWSIVGHQFCQAVKEFFNSGSLLKQINHTAIVLVPKTTHASAVTDYRPISCCNVLYKVISKILASRMVPILSSIVDQAQAAFVEGRSIANNVHLVHELLQKYCRKRISPRYILKVDLCTTYNSVNWSFIRQVMRGLGFHSRFVGWVMECISSPSYLIVVNGALCGFFKGASAGRPHIALHFCVMHGISF